MKKGLSFDSFAGLIGVTRQTLYNWIKKHKDFAKAKDLGEMKSLLAWEIMGIKGTTGKLARFNSKSWSFNMINRFKWTMRREVDNISSDGSLSNPKVIMLPSNGRENEQK